MKIRRISRFIYLILFAVYLALELNFSVLGIAQPSQSPPFLSEPEAYAWPTNAGRYLSSTFGETRSAHLHTGIDIKTWGKEGYDVYATRDGVLYRVQTGPSGYGNALYLKHDDESYSVYAHLRNFVPEITRIVDSVRIQELRHDVDLIVEAHQIRFLKGQKIAYTGSTGIGPPHLHFELRSADNVPYNPLYARFDVLDRIAPRIHSVLVEEYGLGTSRALINVSDGSQTEVTSGVTSTVPSGTDRIVHRSIPSGIPNRIPSGVRFRQIENKPLQTLDNGLIDFGTIETSGSLLLSVDASDRANDVSNVYAVYELELYLGDTLVFASRASRLPFETSSHMFMDRHYEWLRTKRKGYQRLHVLQGNQLPMYRTSSSEGILNLSEGMHTLTIRARDFYGNTTQGTLRVNQIASAPALAMSDLNIVNASPTDNFRDIFKELLTELDQRATQTSVIDTMLTPGRAYFLETPDRRFFMEIPDGALFEPVRLTFSVSRSSDQDLTFLVTPNPVPFATPVRIGALLDAPDWVDRTPFEAIKPDLKTGFAWLPDKPIATGRSSSGRWVTFQSLEIGPFTTYTDLDSPVLSNPKRIQLPEGLTSAEVRVTRESSPIDRLSATFEIDGIPGIPIYDPEYKSFRFYHPQVALKPGSRVRFSVADQFGNRTRQEWQYQNGRFTR